MNESSWPPATQPQSIYCKTSTSPSDGDRALPYGIIFQPRHRFCNGRPKPASGNSAGLHSQGAEGAAVVRLLQALGNTGYGALRCSRREIGLLIA